MKLLEIIAEKIYQHTGYVPVHLKEKEEEYKQSLEQKYDIIGDLTKKVTGNTKTIRQLESKISELTASYTETADKLDEAERIIVETKGFSMWELNKTNLKLKADLAEANEYYKSVQAQVTELMKGTTIFGVDAENPMPGAIVFKGEGEYTLNSKYDDNTIFIGGTTALRGDLQSAIEQYADITDRHEAVLNHLFKHGLVINRMVRELIRSGAIQMTFGYDIEKKCTMCYYSIEAKRFNPPYEFKSDKE